MLGSGLCYSFLSSVANEETALNSVDHILLLLIVILNCDLCFIKTKLELIQLL